MLLYVQMYAYVCAHYETIETDFDLVLYSGNLCIVSIFIEGIY